MGFLRDAGQAFLTNLARFGTVSCAPMDPAADSSAFTPRCPECKVYYLNGQPHTASCSLDAERREERKERMG